MTFSLYEEFSEFHVFKGFKTLLSEWWQLDIFLIEKNHKGSFYSSNTQINNQITKTLLSSDLFQEDFLNSLNLLSQQKLEAHKIYTVLWKQVGSEIFAIPILVKGSLEGFVVTTGFMPHDRNRLSAVLDYLKKEKEWQETEIARLNKPAQRDLVYLKKLLCILVDESLSLYEQKKEQHLFEKFKNNNGESQEVIGKSVAMQFLCNVLDKIKNSEKPLLIHGEKGVGKKFLAEAIHFNSPRKAGPFEILDCSSLNTSSAKTELFGEISPEKKSGLLEKTQSGTLVLDKIETLSPSLQAKILKFLEEGIFFSVGDTQKPRKSNSRILALSSSHLKKALETKAFREDLYYKLNVMNLKVPALRDRLEDVPLLIQHFIKSKFPEKKKKLSPRAMKHLFNYSWPENIKELQNEIEKMIILADDKETLLTEKHLSSKIYTTNFQLPDSTTSLKEAVDNFEKQLILNELEKEGWNKSAVAKKLNLSRTSLLYKAKLYGLFAKKEA